jgi:hypothetical protein
MAFKQSSIREILSDVNKEGSDGIFLPYIQRDFIWEPKHIYYLLDSLMRHYPIGSLLLWRTPQPLKYRLFLQNYEQDLDFEDLIISPALESRPRKRLYVLDGQQRIQSLYIAIHGTYEGKELYFDLNSDPEINGHYRFEFLDEKESREKPEGYWIKVKDLINVDPTGRSTAKLSHYLEKEGYIDPAQDGNTQERFKENAMRLYQVFMVDSIFATHTLDSEFPTNDVAEIFVRTNSAGVVLTKADLLLAMIKGNWMEAGGEFDIVQNELSRLGHKAPRDFVFRAFCAMIKQDAKYDAKIFMSDEVQQKVKDDFRILFSAISDVLQFVAENKHVGARNVPSWKPLLILTCYRYHHPDAWRERAQDIVYFLYASFLSKAFSKSNLKLLSALITYATKSSDFDKKEIEAICKKANTDMSVDVDELLSITKDDSKFRLVMHLIYRGKSDYDPNFEYQADHIFPVSDLKKLKKGRKLLYPKKSQDHIANCEYLTQAINGSGGKGTKLPEVYFPTLRKDVLQYHCIPEEPSLWKLDRYEDFLIERKKLLKNAISINLGGFAAPPSKKDKTLIDRILGK